MDYRQTALLRIFNNAKTDFSLEGSFDDFDFGGVMPSDDAVFNSSVLMTPRSSSVYKGTTTLLFNRIDLDTVAKEQIPSIYDRTVHECLKTINTTTSFDLSAADILAANIPPLTHGVRFDGVTRETEIVAAAGSWYYIGRTILQFCMPLMPKDVSEVVVINTNCTLGPEIKESARAYTIDMEHTEWFYYLGNSFDVIDFDIDLIFNAHGGFTYITGNFRLSYHLFEQDYIDQVGRTVVMDHYGMVMEVLPDPAFDSYQFKTMQYRSGHVYFVNASGGVSRFDQDMLLDENWSIVLPNYDATHLEVGTDLEIWVGSGLTDISGNVLMGMTIRHYSVDLNLEWTRDLSFPTGAHSQSKQLLSIDGALYVSGIKIDTTDQECILPADDTNTLNDEGANNPFTKLARDGTNDLGYAYHLPKLREDYFALPSTVNEHFSFPYGRTINLVKDGYNLLTGRATPVVIPFTETGNLDASRLLNGGLLPDLVGPIKYYDSGTDIFVMSARHERLTPEGVNERMIVIVSKTLLRPVKIIPEAQQDIKVFIQRVGGDTSLN